jgi:Bacterial mobilisation protein (MobC)
MINDTTSQTPKRNRGGRPRKLDSEFRGYSLKVGLNDFEYQKLIDRSESVGLGSPRMRSEFIRKLLLNSKINSVPMINKSAIAELNRIGNNLNQLAKAANSNAAIDPVKIAKIHAAINTIGQNLLGVQP